MSQGRMLCSRGTTEVLVYYQYRDETLIKKLEKGERMK